MAGQPKEHLHVGIDAEIMRAVREYAAYNGITLAAAVSVLLRRGLQAESDRK